MLKKFEEFIFNTEKVTKIDETINISDNVVEMIYKVGMENRDYINEKFRKYIKNGEVDIEMLERDLNITNESFSFPTILKYLKKIFVVVPKGIADLFHFLHVELFKDVRSSYKNKQYVDMSLPLLLITMVVAFEVMVSTLVFIESSKYVEHKMYGLDKGQVVSISFKKPMTRKRRHYAGKGQTFTLRFTTQAVYEARVVGRGNRVEVWETTNLSAGDSTNRGDIIQLDENWSWVSTYDKGQE